jgi:hypothetical protein
MRASMLALAALSAPLLGAVPASSADSPAWLHIRVEEPGKESKVHVNLPLPVLEAAISVAPDAVSSHGRIHLGPDGHNLRISDMRQIWKELKASGDTEIVTVEDKEEHVKVSRKGDLVMVRIDKEGRHESVRVDVPVSLVDALFAGPGDELDVRAALGELRKLRGDVVRIHDEDTVVRIWIDESAMSSRGDK